MLNSFITWFLRGLLGLTRWQKQAIVFAADCVLLALSVWVAYSLRIGVWVLWSDAIRNLLLGTSLLFIPTFYLSGMYQAIFRYAGVGMMRIMLRAFTSYTVLTFAIFMVLGIVGVPRTMGLLQPAVFFLFVAGSRLAARFLLLDILNRRSHKGQVHRVLIYGAGDVGQQVASSIRSDPHMQTVGFIDNEAGMDGQKLDGVRVYSSSRLNEVIENEEVSDILLALQGASRRQKLDIIKDLQKYDLEVKTLPPTREIVSGKVSLSDMRPVQIEDLLGREAVSPDAILLGRTIASKTVLVTGAGGSIGSELCRQIAAIGARKIILFDHSEFALYSIERELLAIKGCGAEFVTVLGSVTNDLPVQMTFASHRIDTVFHAAAYKHVPLVEANVIEGTRNNVLGTQKIAEASAEHGVSDFILVSTDKAVRPTNVMGATKRAAEQVIQAFSANSEATRFSMVRFGNVLGSSGSVVPLFRKQIERGGPITVTDRRITRYFMTIPEAASLVIQAAGMAKGGEVFVLDMGRPMRIMDLARTMVRLAGLTMRDKVNPEGDIVIEEVGLRPGEKLYEELLIGEDPKRTRHPQIMMAHESFLPWNRMKRSLALIASAQDADLVVATLQDIVPEFAHRRDNLVTEATA